MRGIRFRCTKNLLGNFSRKLRISCISTKPNFRIHKRSILCHRLTKVFQELIKFMSREKKVSLINISMNHKKWVHIKNIQNQLLLINSKMFSLVSRCIKKIRHRNFSWNRLFLIALWISRRSRSNMWSQVRKVYLLLRICLTSAEIFWEIGSNLWRRKLIINLLRSF